MTDDRDTPCLAQQTLSATATKVGGISVVVREAKETVFVTDRQ